MPYRGRPPSIVVVTSAKALLSFNLGRRRNPPNRGQLDAGDAQPTVVVATARRDSSSAPPSSLPSPAIPGNSAVEGATRCWGDGGRRRGGSSQAGDDVRGGAELAQEGQPHH
jgi:hypothetical protein